MEISLNNFMCFFKMEVNLQSVLNCAAKIDVTFEISALQYYVLQQKKHKVPVLSVETNINLFRNFAIQVPKIFPAYCIFPQENLTFNQPALFVNF